ncbi:DUF2087 domain-containing protein, partial [bacterium]
IVLKQFALRFEPGRRYGEQEVTGMILTLFDDYCTIRRLLVDEGLINREGAWYWRDGQPGDTADTAPPPAPEVHTQGKDHKGSVRSMVKRMYKQNSPDMGVYQIRNTVNGRIYVGSTTNLEGIRNSRMFQLRMGKVVFSRELQKDLDQFGAGSFEFSVLEALERTEPGENSERSLASLYLNWLEKLQPFGDRGYNSEKAYQRDLHRFQTLNGDVPV